MKTMEKLKQWLHGVNERRRARNAQLRHSALVRESERTVQAREFSGEVYLCVNNEPILPADGLTWDLPTSLAIARASWVKWQEKEARYGRCR